MLVYLINNVCSLPVPTMCRFPVGIYKKLEPSSHFTSNSMFAFGGTFVQWQRECNCNLKKHTYRKKIKDCTSIEDVEVTSCTGHCDTKSM